MHVYGVTGTESCVANGSRGSVDVTSTEHIRVASTERVHYVGLSLNIAAVYKS